MELKVKVSDLVSSVPGFRELTTQRLVARTGHQIARNLKLVVTELELYEKQRKDTATALGGVEEAMSGQFTFPDDGKKKEFEKQLKDLMESTITLNVDKINLSALDDCKISIASMMQLDWLIDQEH